MQDNGFAYRIEKMLEVIIFIIILTAVTLQRLVKKMESMRYVAIAKGRFFLNNVCISDTNTTTNTTAPSSSMIINYD